MLDDRNHIIYSNLTDELLGTLPNRFPLSLAALVRIPAPNWIHRGLDECIVPYGMHGVAQRKAQAQPPAVSKA